MPVYRCKSTTLLYFSNFLPWVQPLTVENTTILMLTIKTTTLKFISSLNFLNCFLYMLYTNHRANSKVVWDNLSHNIPQISWISTELTWSTFFYFYCLSFFMLQTQLLIQVFLCKSYILIFFFNLWMNTGYHFEKNGFLWLKKQFFQVYLINQRRTKQNYRRNIAWEITSVWIV